MARHEARKNEKTINKSNKQQATSNPNEKHNKMRLWKPAAKKKDPRTSSTTSNQSIDHQANQANSNQRRSRNEPHSRRSRLQKTDLIVVEVESAFWTDDRDDEKAWRSRSHELRKSIMSSTTSSNNNKKPIVVHTIARDSTKGIKVDVSDIAKPYRDEIKNAVEELKRCGLGKHDDCWWW